ncbi:MAG TPA: hypothetical protein VGD65_13945 [Chryseosolibacter sp.]
MTRSLVVVLTALTLSSCFHEELPELNEEEFGEARPLVLGKKLSNPFAIDNMQRAYQNLHKSDSASFLFLETLKPTHWYIRFLPENFEQYDALAADSSLELFDHPLDFEIAQPGDFYHDPAVPSDRPTYQYARVPVGYTSLHNVAFEILDELYLPRFGTNSLRLMGRVQSGSEVEEEQLEEEAFRLAGYTVDEPAVTPNSAARKNSKWTPSGKITVYDSRLKKYIPLAGVKIQARRWFEVETAITNEEGYYRMNDAFRKEVSYKLIWERDRFDIRSGTFGQAVVNGPKRRGEWNLQIEANSINFHYAHVFRAAMRYYYGDIGGLKRPGFRLKYSVFNKRGNHMARNIGNWSAFGINPNILIYRYSSLDGSENDSDEMFSATCHETAHTTHMEVMRGGVVQFSQVSEKIRESWAIGVEWYITQLEYKELGIPNYAEPSYGVQVNYPSLYGFQFWSKDRNESLTSLFIDLVDKNNQKGQRFGNYKSGSVDDRIYGYSMAEIESSILKDSYGLSSLSANLKKHKKAETTDELIDLFLGYF